MDKTDSVAAAQPTTPKPDTVTETTDVETTIADDVNIDLIIP